MLDRVCQGLLAVVLFVAATCAGAQTPSYQGIWWAAPAGSESGWGINFTHQGDLIFATWFTYDANGRALWLIATLQPTQPGIYAGTLYRTSGPPLGTAPFDPSAVTATEAGYAEVAFSDATSATFTYTVGAVTQTKSIVPQVFRSLPQCRFVAPEALAYTANYTGLWWAAPAGSESGWGINFAHQEDVIFAAWFTYDVDGQPLWLVAALARQGSYFVGDVYRATGPPLGAAPFDPAKVTPAQVGNAALWLGYEGYEADGNTGTFSFTVNGVTQTKSITQQIFGSQATACTQVYGSDDIVAKFAAAAPDGAADAIAFASRLQLSAFHVDFLTGAAPGTTVRFIREHQLPLLSGGARIAGYGLPFANSIVTSSDPRAVSYPADYGSGTAKDVTVEDPYCDPEPATIAFPAAYLGPHALPAINVAPNRGAFRRIAYLKDVWGKPNANFVPGCRRDPKEAFRATLQRLKRLGVDTIFVIPWTMFDPTGASWRVLNPAETRSSTIGDADLEWLVHEAKAEGFSVYWRNQIQGLQAANGPYLPYPMPTVENVLKSYDALEAYLEERGPFLQRIGVDGVSLGSWYWAGFAQILSPEVYVDRTARLIKKLKAGFDGKVSYDGDSMIAADPYLAGAIDHYEMGIWAWNVTADDEQSFTVASLKAKFRQMMESFRGTAIYGKPMIWTLAFPSRSDPFTSGSLEETFCTAGYDLGVDYSEDCIQEGKQTDFALQAIANEAAFEAIFEQDWGSPVGISIAYWMDDNVLPSFTFPNLATSIRGKPAEAIAYRWFQP